MKRLFTFFLAAVAAYAAAQPVKNRVVPNDPATYRALSAVHAGAGKMGFTQLIGRTELSTNFLYLHAGVIKRSQVSAITFITTLKRCMCC